MIRLPGVGAMVLDAMFAGRWREAHAIAREPGSRVTLDRPPPHGFTVAIWPHVVGYEFDVVERNDQGKPKTFRGRRKLPIAVHTVDDLITTDASGQVIALPFECVAEVAGKPAGFEVFNDAGIMLISGPVECGEVVAGEVISMSVDVGVSRGIRSLRSIENVAALTRGLL